VFYMRSVPVYHRQGQLVVAVSNERVSELQVGRQILAGGSLLRSGQTQVGDLNIGEHAQ
jgi:hypothetical protein